jgi:hypothetical protein
LSASPLSDSESLSDSSLLDWVLLVSSGLSVAIGGGNGAFISTALERGGGIVGFVSVITASKNQLTLAPSSTLDSNACLN